MAAGAGRSRPGPLGTLVVAGWLQESGGYGSEVTRIGEGGRMRDREAERVLDALEAYVATVDPSRAVRKAFLAGVAVGRQCAAKKLSTGSTGRAAAEPSALGFQSSPLNKPPISTSPLQDPSSPDPDPDLRSMECANSRARETLALTPPPPTVLRRAVILPAQFTLTADRRAFAENGGLDAGQEFGWFKDHHRAKGTTFVDWEAAWRTWCRRAARFGRGLGGLGKP
jgi:hypothetical protein